MIKLLDCTLRDGGFVNDWNFGKKTMHSLYRRLTNAGIDVIEVGFLDERRETDLNRSINPKVSDFDNIFATAEKKAATVAMIDFGTADIKNIPDAADTFLDGFRVIFKKKDIPQALDFCSRLKDKGFFVSVQPVSVTTYSDREMLDLIDEVNKFSPDAVSIVDTYGLLHKEQLMRYFYLLDRNLNPQTAIGFHSHNNFQLAYANCIDVLKSHINRDLILDATCYGMGKSAGNACTELLAMYLNDNFQKSYSIAEIMEIIDCDIIKIYQETPWGYAFDYYLSAQSKVHPKYVQYLKKKKTLTVSSIMKVLEKVPDEIKLTFDEKVIEKLYFEYQEKETNDSGVVDVLSRVFAQREILLLGPGSSIKENAGLIKKYAGAKNTVTISVNCAPGDFHQDYVFISNAKRYEQLLDVLLQNRTPLIATSNITPSDKEPDYVLNYARLLPEPSAVADNSLIMICRALARMGCGCVLLAGFDGFSKTAENFYNPYLSFSDIPDDPAEFNRLIGRELKKTGLDIRFLTPSLYEV